MWLSALAFSLLPAALSHEVRPLPLGLLPLHVARAPPGTRLFNRSPGRRPLPSALPSVVPSFAAAACRPWLAWAAVAVAVEKRAAAGREDRARFGATRAAGRRGGHPISPRLIAAHARRRAARLGTRTSRRFRRRVRWVGGGRSGVGRVRAAVWWRHGCDFGGRPPLWSVAPPRAAPGGPRLTGGRARCGARRQRLAVVAAACGSCGDCGGLVVGGRDRPCPRWRSCAPGAPRPVAAAAALWRPVWTPAYRWDNAVDVTQRGWASEVRCCRLGRVPTARRACCSQLSPPLCRLFSALLGASTAAPPRGSGAPPRQWCASARTSWAQRSGGATMGWLSWRSTGRRGSSRPSRL